MVRKGRKSTGGRYKPSKKKKLYELPGQKRIIKLGEEDKRKLKKTKGGGRKTVMLRASTVNVSYENKIKKAKIKNVSETPSNRFLARQNIITKGTIVETDLGKVKITNRPTQEGVLNGVLLK